METWYVLEDGSVGDPRLIAPGEDGVLRHKDGRAVAYAPHGPRSRGGVNAEAERAKVGKPVKMVEPVVVAPVVDAEPEAITANREVVPEEPKRTYKTRGAKSE